MNCLPTAIPQDAATEAESLANLAAAVHDITDILRAENDGALSPAEAAIAAANTRDADRYARAAAARKIIAETMFDAQMEWEELIESAWAGEMAAELYATWAPINLLEPICECDYADKLPGDIQSALSAREEPAVYALACENIGRALVESASRYIFDCHGMIDAELAREDAAAMDTEYQRRIARGGE